MHGGRLSLLCPECNHVHAREEDQNDIVNAENIEDSIQIQLMKSIFCSHAGMAAALFAYIALWVLNAMLSAGPFKLLGMGFLFVVAAIGILAHKKRAQPMKSDTPSEVGENGSFVT